MQPTNKQLEEALEKAKLDKHHIKNLLEIRNDRTTWAFTYELNLRKNIDKFLEETV